MHLTRALVFLLLPFVLACGRTAFDESEPSALDCPAGTYSDGKVCVRPIPCGPGTKVSNGQCVPASTAPPPPPAPSLACGSGTELIDGYCVPDGSQCGDGTRLDGGRCVIEDPEVPLVCGLGTREESGKCVAHCGPGTRLESGECIPSDGPVCGPGTHEEGDICASDVTCGPGTALSGSQCLPASGAWYDIRLGGTTLSADGFSKQPFLALGRLADGSPSSEEVIVTLTRSSAGVVTPATFELGPLGTLGYLQPCNSANSTTCTGPARLQLALASDPSTIVATSEEFLLVAPTGVGTSTPCLVAPNALFFDGTSYIFNGTQLVTLGAFDADALYGYGQQTTSNATNHVRIRIEPTDPAQGSWWYLDFSSEKLGADLMVQTYNGAFRWPFQPVNTPGLDVGGDGRGCNQLSGRFEIQRLTVQNHQLTEFLATFEQFCELQPSNVLRGCVHVTQ